MNPIREFFKKKKSERNFKSAGPGHKLNETSEKLKKDSKAVHSTNARSSRHQPHSLSEEAQRAGAAALARIEQKQAPSVNWSLQATKAKARKELELENSQKLTQKFKQATVPKEIVQDGCTALTVSGVYFTCPLIGPEVLPKKDIEEKIKSFLYEQLEQERELTACLLIHTLNKNKDKVQIGVETLSRYLTNIIDNPNEEKYRKIRFKNKIFQERIVGLEGAFDFLIAAGFSHQKLNVNDAEAEDYFVFPEDSMDSMNLENMQMMKEALLSAEPILPVLDRNLRVLKPSEVVENVNLPNDFFYLSAEELKREQELKAEAAELMTQLRTKAMRERDEIRELHVYKYTLIRIRFPNGIILQGTFYVYEKLSAVKVFIRENLNDPEKEFHLLLPGGIKLIEDDHSLLELKLVPAVILNFQWPSDSSKGADASYLKSETMSLLADL